MCQEFCPQGAPGQTTPPGRPPQPSDGQSSGRYASYWNAFLYWNKSKRHIASRWVHRELKIVFTLGSDKDHRKNSLSLLFAVNDLKWDTVYKFYCTSFRATSGGRPRVSTSARWMWQWSGTGRCSTCPTRLPGHPTTRWDKLRHQGRNQGNQARQGEYQTLGAPNYPPGQAAPSGAKPGEPGQARVSTRLPGRPTTRRGKPHHRGETRGTRPGRVSPRLPGRLTTPGQAAPSVAKPGEPGQAGWVPYSRGVQLPAGASYTVRGETRGTRPGWVSTKLPGRPTTSRVRPRRQGPNQGTRPGRMSTDSWGAKLPPGTGRSIRGETKGTRPGMVSTRLPGRLTTPEARCSIRGETWACRVCSVL